MYEDCVCGVGDSCRSQGRTGAAGRGKVGEQPRLKGHNPYPVTRRNVFVLGTRPPPRQNSPPQWRQQGDLWVHQKDEEVGERRPQDSIDRASFARPDKDIPGSGTVVGPSPTRVTPQPGVRGCRKGLPSFLLVPRRDPDKGSLPVTLIP